MSPWSLPDNDCLLNHSWSWSPWSWSPRSWSPWTRSISSISSTVSTVTSPLGAESVFIENLEQSWKCYLARPIRVARRTNRRLSCMITLMLHNVIAWNVSVYIYETYSHGHESPPFGSTNKDDRPKPFSSSGCDRQCKVEWRHLSISVIFFRLTSFSFSFTNR